ncbi:hypothetical protein pv_382 [Pithovirus sibericum]|uniref:Uncharacterized protein n=1 Tax=Pithovirus sibericum TaxID=1450746 RepID=W5S599_9VIRU|nr:hypothetical protein pv_382 [Pithovirus sibericum]AHH01948.1 hypothetical protein pv_382 [Pithovirus sibericum]
MASQLSPRSFSSSDVPGSPSAVTGNPPPYFYSASSPRPQYSQNPSQLNQNVWNGGLGISPSQAVGLSPVATPSPPPLTYGELTANQVLTPQQPRSASQVMMQPNLTIVPRLASFPSSPRAPTSPRAVPTPLTPITSTPSSYSGVGSVQVISSPSPQTFPLLAAPTRPITQPDTRSFLYSEENTGFPGGRQSVSANSVPSYNLKGSGNYPIGIPSGRNEDLLPRSSASLAGSYTSPSSGSPGGGNGQYDPNRGSVATDTIGWRSSYDGRRTLPSNGLNGSSSLDTLQGLVFGGDGSSFVVSNKAAPLISGNRQIPVSYGNGQGYAQIQEIAQSPPSSLPSSDRRLFAYSNLFGSGNLSGNTGTSSSGTNSGYGSTSPGRSPNDITSVARAVGTDRQLSPQSLEFGPGGYYQNS